MLKNCFMKEVKIYKDVRALDVQAFKMLRQSKLLVDYDGVVLTSPRINKYIQSKCEKYVSFITGIYGKDKLQVLNKHLYTTHGHTVSGLRTLGYSVNMCEFNKYVYDDIDFNRLTLCDDELDILGLESLAKRDDVYIFSNAPAAWIVGTLSANTITRKLIPRIKIIKLFGSEIIKPQLKVYLEVAKTLKSKDDTDLFLLDDNFLNVQSAVQVKNWKGLWLSGEDFRVNEDIQSVKNVNSALFQINLAHH